MTNRQARALARLKKIEPGTEEADRVVRTGFAAAMAEFGAKVSEGKDVFGSVARRAHQADKDHLERNTPVRSAFSAGTSTSRLNLRAYSGKNT